MTAADLMASGPTRIMGVINVTPDSFSDGGQWFHRDEAIRHGRALAEAGADVLDVGGESTRPGSTRPTAEEELERTVPVVAALAAEGLMVSIDTMRVETARACLDAGAVMINDVSGGLADPQMPGFVASTGVPYVTMHWRGLLTDPDEEPAYHDVTAEVCAELTARVDALLEAGVRPGQLLLDPGFGFSKNGAHNWELLADLPEVVALGYPVVVGTSRKRFLGRLPARPGVDLDRGGAPRPAAERDHATAATSVLAAQAGAWAVRVHDVVSTRDALAVWEMVERAR